MPPACRVPATASQCALQARLPRLPVEMHCLRLATQEQSVPKCWNGGQGITGSNGCSSWGWTEVNADGGLVTLTGPGASADQGAQVQSCGTGRAGHRQHRRSTGPGSGPWPCRDTDWFWWRRAGASSRRLPTQQPSCTAPRAGAIQVRPRRSLSSAWQMCCLARRALPCAGLAAVLCCSLGPFGCRH
jgi:hypothetical protein